MVIVLLIATLSAAFVMFGPAPMNVRFYRPALNEWAFAAFLALPPALIMQLFLNLQESPLQMLGIACSLILALLGLLGGFFTLLASPSFWDRDHPSQLLLSEATSDAGTFRLYRTDCGATCSFTLVLRREIDTPIGIRLVDPVWMRDEEHEGRIEVSEGGNVAVLQGQQVLVSFQP
jgi:hypothetical protein